MAAAGEIPMLDAVPAATLAGLTDLQVRRLQRLVPLPEREFRHRPNVVAAKLRIALEGERGRGRRQHWGYDANRHVALARALRFYEGKRETPE